jgi:hypothetical protein
LVALIASLGTIAAASISGKQGNDAAQVHRCATSKLVIWSKNGVGGGAAGSHYLKLTITNLSESRCTLSGFPEIAAVDLSGRRIGAKARPELDAEAKEIMLSRHGSASFVLKYGTAANWPPSKCHARMAASLRVVLPGGTAPHLVPYPFERCSQPPGDSSLTVGPITSSG